MLAYIGLATCSQLFLGFWESCWELFSVNNPVLHYGQSAFGQSIVYFMIDQFFSVDHTYGQLELYVFCQD